LKILDLENSRPGGKVRLYDSVAAAAKALRVTKAHVRHLISTGWLVRIVVPEIPPLAPAHRSALRHAA
jgi:hypothetical protein